MVNEVETELTGHIDGQHFRLIGPREHPRNRGLGEAGGARLAVAVQLGGAQQAAHLHEIGEVRLPPPGEAVDHMVEQPLAAIGAAGHQRAPGEISGRRLRVRLAQPGDAGLVDLPRHQGEGGVARPAGALAGAVPRRRRGGGGDEAQRRRRRVDAVDQAAMAAIVEITLPRGGPPAFPRHAAHQHAPEGKASRVEGAETREAHHLLGRAHQRGDGLALTGGKSHGSPLPPGAGARG